MTQNSDALYGQEHVDHYRERWGTPAYREKTDREIPVVVLERE